MSRGEQDRLADEEGRAAVRRVAAAINRHRRHYSLEMLVENEIDIADPADHDLHEDLHSSLLPDEVQAVLETLSEREAGVVRLRFGLTDRQPRTLEEIGQVYGVTRERIRQIEREAMEKLREAVRSDCLRGYFDEL